LPEQEQNSPVARNIVAVTVSHFLLKMVSAIITIVIARYLGVRELGYYATAIGFASLAGILTNAGLRDILIKNISIKRENIEEFIASAIFIQFVLSFSVYLMMLFLSGFFHYEPLVVSLIYTGGATAFLTDFIEFLFAYYYGIQKVGRIVVFRLVYFISLNILIGLILFFQKGLLTIILANFSVAVLVTVLLLFSIVRETGFQVNPALFLPLLRESLPFGLNIIYNIAYTRIGIVLLSLFSGAAGVGLYDSSYKVITLLGIIPNIVLTAIYPVMFRLGVNSGQDYRQTFLRTLKFLCFIGFPASFFLFIYASQVSTLIYGKSFAGAGSILKILSFIFACQCISFPLLDSLTTRNRQAARTRITGLMFIFTLLANLTLIPVYQAMGTAFAALSAEVLLAAVLLYFVKSQFFAVRIFEIAGKELLASVIMATCLYFLYNNFTENIFSGFIGGSLVYLATWAVLNNFRFPDNL
jgi:O-antigen/teichoic acid export membrane protein